MKVCSTCKSNKCIDAFGKNKSRRDGLHSECKECRKVRAGMSEKYKQYQKVYWKDYRGRVTDRKIYDKKSKRKSIDELSKTYIASKLKIPSSKLTPELLELKRAQIEMYRLTKQLNKEIQNGIK